MLTACRAGLRKRVFLPATRINHFSTTKHVLKKARGGSTSQQDQPVGNVADLDLSAMKDSLESAVKEFVAAIKQAKSSPLNTERISNINVDLGKGASSTLKQLATVVSRGNKVNVVAFDPKQVKHIRTAIVSELGMSAESSKTDEQTLSVVIPEESQNKKAVTVQKIKQAYDTIRNNSSHPSSISSVRAKYRALLKKLNLPKSDLTKESKKLEDTVQIYMKKLKDLHDKEV